MDRDGRGSAQKTHYGPPYVGRGASLLALV